MPDATNLVCIGNLTIDEAVSPAGERIESIGGDALFAGLAARLTGASPTIVTPMGTDATPALLAAVRVAGTDPASLPRRELPTIRNVIHYDAAGGRVWDLVKGVEHFESMSVHPADISDAVLAAEGILLSAMALRAQLDLAAWLRPRTDATIYFDPQEDYIEGHEAELFEAVRACDVFLPSEIEARTLSGTSGLEDAARTFLESGPRVVVIKLAEAGCLLATRDHPEPRLLPTDVVDVVDSTGAGDAFCGGFAAEHLRSGDAVAAARAGASAARIAVSGNGVDALLSAVGAGAAR